MGEVQISANQARELTDRIKVGVEAVWELVKQAYVSRVWDVLGYPSWDDYCTREFGTSRIRLPREERQEVVSSMREIGMSTRAIASATGVSQKTISRDTSGESFDSPAPVTGTDGKTYTPRPASQPPRPEPSAQLCPDEEIPTTTIIGTDDLAEINAQAPTPKPEAKAEPQKPRRTPITDDANRIGWEIRKAFEKLEKLTEDDRYNTNKEKVTPLLRGHLQYSIETATNVLDNFTQEG